MYVCVCVSTYVCVCMCEYICTYVCVCVSTCSIFHLEGGREEGRGALYESLICRDSSAFGWGGGFCMNP